MTPWQLWAVLAVITVVLIIYSIRKNQSVKYNKTIVIRSPKPFLQSPEYRCSTKCFDCVKQQSHLYLQKSHGQPNMHVGM